LDYVLTYIHSIQYNTTWNENAADSPTRPAAASAPATHRCSRLLLSLVRALPAAREHCRFHFLITTVRLSCFGFGIGTGACFRCFTLPCCCLFICSGKAKDSMRSPTECANPCINRSKMSMTSAKLRRNSKRLRRVKNESLLNKPNTCTSSYTLR